MAELNLASYRPSLQRISPALLSDDDDYCMNIIIIIIILIIIILIILIIIIIILILILIILIIIIQASTGLLAFAISKAIPGKERKEAD